MRMVEFQEKLYIYGGWNKVEHFDTFSEYDLTTKQWRHFSLPLWKEGDGKIGQHSMTVFDNILYIFAGFNSLLESSTSQLFAYRLARPQINADTSP